MIENEANGEETYDGFFSTNLGMIILGVIVYFVMSGVDYVDRTVLGYSFIGFNLIAFCGLGLTALGIISFIIEKLKKKQ